MACHEQPRAPAILKAQRSCLYMAPRAWHVPGSMPSSNARANTTAWGMRSKHLTWSMLIPATAHPRRRHSSKRTCVASAPSKALLAGWKPKPAGWAQNFCHAMVSARRTPAPSL